MPYYNAEGIWKQNKGYKVWHQWITHFHFTDSTIQPCDICHNSQMAQINSDKVRMNTEIFKARSVWSVATSACSYKFRFNKFDISTQSSRLVQWVCPPEAILQTWTLKPTPYLATKSQWYVRQRIIVIEGLRPWSGCQLLWIKRNMMLNISKSHPLFPTQNLSKTDVALTPIPGAWLWNTVPSEQWKLFGEKNKPNQLSIINIYIYILKKVANWVAHVWCEKCDIKCYTCQTMYLEKYYKFLC